MEKTKIIKRILPAIILIFICSCQRSDKNILVEKNKEQFEVVLIKHLNSVKNKDLGSLKETMSPKGEMELLLPDEKPTYTVTEFIDFHKNWFQSKDWKFTFKILTTKIGNKIGVATTHILYEEPNRNGKPYFNKMIVSYTLENINGNWYVIKDHACSIEKTK